MSLVIVLALWGLWQIELMPLWVAIVSTVLFALSLFLKAYKIGQGGD